MDRDTGTPLVIARTSGTRQGVNTNMLKKLCTIPTFKFWLWNLHTLAWNDVRTHPRLEELIMEGRLLELSMISRIGLLRKNEDGGVDAFQPTVEIAKFMATMIKETKMWSRDKIWRDFRLLQPREYTTILFNTNYSIRIMMTTLIKAAEALNMLEGVDKEVIGFEDNAGREPLYWPIISGSTEEIPITYHR